MQSEIKGWGKENYPYPTGEAYIECDEMKCIGCGICQMACSIHHFGVINKDLSRIRVTKHLLPLSKGIQTTCSQCQKEERSCELACPLDPPAVYYDNTSLHMVLDKDRCLGHKCLLCRDACSAEAIRIHPDSSRPFVCDLCDINNDGTRVPQCVDVCPTGALYFKDLKARGFYAIRDLMRKPADEKADLIAKRLYPLPRDSMWQPQGRQNE